MLGSVFTGLLLLGGLVYVSDYGNRQAPDGQDEIVAQTRLNSEPRLHSEPNLNRETFKKAIEQGKAAAPEMVRTQLDPAQIQAALSLLAQNESISDLDLAEVSLMLHGKSNEQTELALQKYQLKDRLQRQGVLNYQSQEKQALEAVLTLETLPVGLTLRQVYEQQLGQAQKNAMAEGVVPGH